MAGFGKVLIRGYFGDSTTYKAEGQHITGVNEDGSATGSANVSVTRAETEKGSVDDVNNDPRLERIYDWPTAIIELNRSEIGSRAANYIHRGHSQEKAWAHEINRSLKRGMLKASSDKLVSDLHSSHIIDKAILFPTFCVSGGKRYGTYTDTRRRHIDWIVRR